MRILLNGRPIAGEGTNDEPPPAFHVFRRLIGRPLKQVATLPGGGEFETDRLRLAFEDGRILECSIHLTPVPDGTEVELQVDVQRGGPKDLEDLVGPER